MKSIILATCGLISVLILALLTLNNNGSRPVQMHSHARITRFRGGKDKHRIAIVIPFFGESPEAIPPYLNLFCTAAAGSSSLVDFFMVHNGVLEAYTEPVPSNVKFVNVGSTKAFAELLVRVVDRKTDLAVDSRETLVKIVTYHVHQYPYVLVEFKPAIGHIFASLLKGYSHWGYADLDIAFGDLPRWITEEELTDYDIVTYGYGDQNRVYLRGQFTFHKNTERVNQLWRECTYLSSMDERFAQVIAGKKKLRVESAEGCYSAAILKRTDIRVKYAVKAFNDINANDSVNTHGLYLGIGSKRDRSVIYKARSPQDGKALLQLSPTWFEDRDNVYGSKERAPLQRQVGKKELVPTTATRKSNCMYWVPESYQSNICISGVNSNETLFWMDGKLYKQPFENTKLPGNVMSRPFFHFQEWKRYYRAAQLATLHHSTEVLGWVLAREGAIPIFPNESHGSRWPTLVSPLGHVMTEWRTADNSNRKMLPHVRYCLRSGPRRHPPQPVVAECFNSVSWQDQERVEILHGAPVWQHIDVKREVTLALTVQITPKQAADNGALDGMLDIVIANINAWQGQPCVVVIHIARATPESIAKVRSRFAVLETDATLVAMISQEETDLISRKALLNMANDAAPTRWVVSGLEVERGLVLSNEASALAYRRAKIHNDSCGTVLVIPQFAIKDDDDKRINLSFNDLAEMRRTGEPVVYGPGEYEDKCDGDEGDKETDKVLRPAHKLWWRLSTKETAGNYVPNDDASVRELALALDDMQLSFTKLLAKENEIELISFDSSPILMTDSIGPHKGMRTSELAREVEEFGGKKCYNGLRLAQLAALNYNIDVLTGVFAISTSSSRHASSGHVVENASGSSRCDSCFMFDHDHESTLHSIINDERARPAKASILWDEMKTLPAIH